MIRTVTALLIAIVFLSTVQPSFGDDSGEGVQAIDTVVFGSCSREDQDQPLWDQIVAQNPELFLYIGDNVYVDQPAPPQTMGDFAAAYRLLAGQPGFQRLKATCPILATWDDHDYGLNDAGVEFPLKEGAQQQLLTFFEEPADSPRWRREGVYGSWAYGPMGRRLQVILLDTRYFRDPLKKNPAGRVNGRGPYVPHDEPGPNLLGDQQWAWLEGVLKQPADVRLIGSSIQVVPSEHGWEGWCNFPYERKRLYNLVAKTGAKGVIFLSGDRHMMEISRDDSPVAPYPMIDFTSSGLNMGVSEVDEPNRFRLGEALRETNFGVIKIDWDATPRSVTLRGIGGEGQTLMEHTLPLNQLSAP